MTTIHLQQALDGLNHHKDVRIEKHCDECAYSEDQAKVRAVSVVSTARCDGCFRAFRLGENYWAIFHPVGSTDREDW